MTWSEVIKALLDGKKVRRGAWNPWLYVTIHKGFIMRSTLTDGLIMYNPYRTELLARDWDIADQSKIDAAWRGIEEARARLAEPTGAETVEFAMGECV